MTQFFLKKNIKYLNNSINLKRKKYHFLYIANKNFELPLNLIYFKTAIKYNKKKDFMTYALGKK